MTRSPVKSSTIKSLGYDPESKRMHVEFHSGGVYEYADVQPHEHAKLCAAESCGKHFHAHIRSAKKGKKL